MTCKPVPAHVWPAKHPDATLDYAVYFEPECVRRWSKEKEFAAGQRIRVFGTGKSAGFEFEPTTPGYTGSRMPVFPSVIGSTVPDGSVVWTCRAISNASVLRTISGIPTWEVDDPDGVVTISGETVSGFTAIAYVAGGADDEDYEVTITATMSDGLIVPKLVILPVRVPVKVC